MDVVRGPRALFEWNSAKAASNSIKLGVTFEEACGVFYDNAALLLDDPIHSVDEERFVLLGFGNKLRLLVVVHCYRAGGRRIRIISARVADASARVRYRDG